MANARRITEVQQTIGNILTEFLEILTHSILYTRNVYPKEAFERQNRYGTSSYVCVHPAVQEYLRNIHKAVQHLAASRQLSHYALLIIDSDGHVMERYTFELSYPRAVDLPDNDHYVNLESHMRDAVQNALNIGDRLGPIDQNIDCSFTVNLHTSKNSLTNANKGQEDFKWREVEKDRVGRSYGLVPIKSLGSAYFKMQAIAEEYPAKRAAVGRPTGLTQ